MSIAFSTWKNDLKIFVLSNTVLGCGISSEVAKKLTMLLMVQKSGNH